MTSNPKKNLNLTHVTNCINDIDGSAPKSKTIVFKNSQRIVNPLNPDYNLHFPLPEKVETRFIRDNMQTQDVCKRVVKERAVRNILNTRDIEGAYPRKERH